MRGTESSAWEGEASVVLNLPSFRGFGRMGVVGEVLVGIYSHFTKFSLRTSLETREKA